MSVIIGGRVSILSQVPQELRSKFPRVGEPLTSQDASLMLQKSIEILSDDKMSNSHQVFCDIIRLVLALQLQVANDNFKDTKLTNFIDS